MPESNNTRFGNSANDCQKGAERQAGVITIRQVTQHHNLDDPPDGWGRTIREIQNKCYPDATTDYYWEAILDCAYYVNLHGERGALRRVSNLDKNTLATELAEARWIPVSQVRFPKPQMDGTFYAESTLRHYCQRQQRGEGTWFYRRGGPAIRQFAKHEHNVTLWHIHADACLQIAGRVKLTQHDIREIQNRYRSGETVAQISHDYANVGWHTIRHHCQKAIPDD